MDTDTKATSVRNRLWVNRYAKGVTAVGAFILACGVAQWVYVYVWQWPHIRPAVGGWALVSTSIFSAGQVLTGLLVFGLADLVRCVLGSKQQPNWLLCHTDKGLYLLAVLRVLGSLSSCCLMVHLGKFEWFRDLGMPLSGAVSSALILVALGVVLRRALPVIEESRTLV